MENIVTFFECVTNSEEHLCYVPRSQRRWFFFASVAIFTYNIIVLWVCGDKLMKIKVSHLISKNHRKIFSFGITFVQRDERKESGK